MYDLSADEHRFALIISSAHFSQHVYYRLLPPLIPVLAVALEYPLWQLGLLISLYSVGMGVSHAPLGVLADRIDRVYLLPTGIALTGAAYMLFAIAPWIGIPLSTIHFLGYAFEGSYLIMGVAMLVVGVGLSVVHPAGYPMITDNVATGNKGKVLGMFGASSKLGDGTAPAVIAVLILAFAWHQIIFGFGLAGVVYGILLFRVLRDERYETVPSGRRRSPESDEKSPNRDTTRRSYLYPMAAMYAFFIASMIATSGLTAFLPTYLIAVYELSFVVGDVTLAPESVANVYFAALLLAGAAMQLVFGGLADRTDARHILLGCMSLGTAGMVVLAVVELHPIALAAVIVLLGAGLFGVNPARDALISELSPPDREGRTFGYIFTVVTLVGAPLPTVIGYLLDTIGMREGYLLLAIGPVLAGLFVSVLYLDAIYDRRETNPVVPDQSD